MGAITVGLSADDNDDWDASVAYTAGALTASSQQTKSSAWEVVSEYDLGGGATAFLTTTESEFTASACPSHSKRNRLRLKIERRFGVALFCCALFFVAPVALQRV